MCRLWFFSVYNTKAQSSSSFHDLQRRLGDMFGVFLENGIQRVKFSYENMSGKAEFSLFFRELNRVCTCKI